jgi:predicted HTH transcriptional regulator
MEEKIFKAFAEKGAMKAGELAQAAGIDKDDAAKAIKKLVAEGKLFSPKRCFYDIKK